MASKEITKQKLKVTGIDKYFEILDKIPVAKNVAVIDDRPKSFDGNYFIKFEYGQYKGQDCNADRYIESLEELLND